MLEEFENIGADLPEPFRVLIKGQVASTNDEIRSRAEAGATEGLIVLADRQSAGRGRRGAAWFSPPGESLAFSVLLRPGEPKALWPRLALATGLAVAEALEAHVPMIGIKWPNDVWAGGKKIAGILVEAGNDFAIIGIGINVNTTTFPPEVSETATSLALETGRDIFRADVFAAVIPSLNRRCRQIGADFHDVIDAIRLRCVLSGNRVSLLTSAGPKSGEVETISANGELIVRTAAGLETFLQADEVRLLQS